MDLYKTVCVAMSDDKFYLEVFSMPFNIEKRFGINCRQRKLKDGSIKLFFINKSNIKLFFRIIRPG